MTEHEPAPSPTWDLSPISDTLSANSELRSDPELGNSVRLHLPHTIELDLFPDTGLVHLSTPDSHIALGHQNPPIIDAFGVVFSHQSDELHTDLTIDTDGAVTLLLTPASHGDAHQTAKRPQETSKSAKRPNPPESLAQPADDDSGTPETPSRSESEPADTEKVAHPRVALLGRLGSAPRFRTTKNDHLIGRFPLAVHHDDETTTWHPVVVFGDRAAQLQSDELAKGELINVVGYEHQRTWTNKKGEEQTEMQVYAAVISRT